MAFSAGSGSGRGWSPRGRRSVSVGTLSEMNVVPLVDVVLVLLIIFMVTAHVMESGLDIDVPAVKEVKETTVDLPRVQISKTGELYLNDQRININELGAEIQKKFKNQKAVYVVADKRAKVEQFVQVANALAVAHFDIKVVTKEQELPNP
ncbi:MAG TPA: biopolymer transporter ExbD [Bryobacteraceae bacterium]|jgi:biopolymer transport protein ExbD